MSTLLAALTRGLLVLGAGMAAIGLILPASSKAPAVALPPPSAPVRLDVPSLKVDAAVLPVAVSAERVLEPPADVRRVGWWDASARPGEGTGQTVLTGHSVHTGGGVLDSLGELRRGARIDVRTEEGDLRYRVSSVTVYDKEQVARRSSAIFGQDRGDGRLVVVSCTDWDGAVYQSNVVVVAEPVGPA